jgi:hypothetical protein
VLTQLKPQTGWLVVASGALPRDMVQRARWMH